MSVYLVRKYISEVQKVRRFGGSSNEGSLEMEFRSLLNEYCKQKGFILVPKIAIKTSTGKTIIPDGVIKDALRLDWGYWESKDEKDDLEEEITAKFSKGYPKDNILFEDTNTAVLYQGGSEFGRAQMDDPEALDKLLTKFLSYERPEVRTFRKAIELFKTDLPIVVQTLREMIDAQSATNKTFCTAREKFFELCKQVINPDISLDDIREMIIQHILTEDIFNTIFDETQFHRENNIAKELAKVEETFFTGQTKRDTLSSVKQYYDVINAAAAGIADHHEKQKFLKVIYETFYKAYNPKAADRLGIVYTPGEIVNFMIESTDYLLHKHFNKFLGDKNVEILDPATGTGTFICDIIDYLPTQSLAYKYKEEIHANEVAILPYYIANLNIEYTYKQKMGEYKEFENICFVDTLDNMGFAFGGKQEGMFGLAAENADRIKRQNEKKISVIIGNPPYNAKQENYSFQNANRTYEQIDKRIKDTYIKRGKAQNQIVVYDMYTRFLRWACDRLTENGIICFITNRSYIDTIPFDGFREVMSEYFSDIYILDLGGDVRLNPKLSGTKNNVFGIQTGVAISMWVKKKEESGKGKIYYARRPEFDTAEDKLAFLSAISLNDISFVEVRPDSKNNWINISDNDFDSLTPLISKDVKSGISQNAVFKTFSRGVATQRDEWVYDFSEGQLQRRMVKFVASYQSSLEGKRDVDNIKIKWDRELTKYLERGISKEYDKESIVNSLYRPYTKMSFYYDRHFNGMTYLWGDIYNSNKTDNYYIAIPGIGSSKDHHAIASRSIIDLNCLPAGCQCLPLYRYDEHGKRIDNITDWGLSQFQEHYKNKKITKEDIFHYVYGVLHNPAYRKKYELNLKREFPRIPLYDDFWKWAKWGKELMELHIGYETAKPFKLAKSHPPTPSTSTEGGKDTGKKAKAKTPKPETRTPKAKLKADKANGIIILDEDSSLLGIPPEAWEYKLGNRSALEWILDQYKEKTPKDPTIREKFNTYKFADYKDKVIDLIARVTTVSVRTVEIMREMEGE